MDGGEGIPMEHLILLPSPGVDTSDLLPKGGDIAFDEGGPDSLGERIRTTKEENEGEASGADTAHRGRPQTFLELE